MGSKMVNARKAPQRASSRKPARQETREEDGQYGWWPALEGEAYRSRLKTFSVLAFPPWSLASFHMCDHTRSPIEIASACVLTTVLSAYARMEQVLASIGSAGYLVLNYENRDGRPHVFSGVRSRVRFVFEYAHSPRARSLAFWMRQGQLGGMLVRDCLRGSRESGVALKGTRTMPR